jgi:hypothetical protein
MLTESARWDDALEAALAEEEEAEPTEEELAADE